MTTAEEVERFDEFESTAIFADDQADVVAALSLLLKGEGFKIDSASSPAGVLKALEGGPE